MWSSHNPRERRAPRYPLDVRAKLCAGEEEIKVRTLDISEGGVGVVSPLEIPQGESLVMEFEFPTIQGVFRSELQVQSRLGVRYGFKFVALDESCMALLRKYQRRRGGILTKVGPAAG